MKEIMCDIFSLFNTYTNCELSLRELRPLQVGQSNIFCLLGQKLNRSEWMFANTGADHEPDPITYNMIIWT